MATVLVAILLYSCKGPAPAAIDFEQTPVQIVHDMQVLQSEKGEAEMRMSAPVMKRYEFTKDSVLQSFELYSDGFLVNAYTENGQLETTIIAEQAKHVTTVGSESWSAFGDVVITNHIKGERVETDTLYWDQATSEIYTDCYIRMYSADGFMQGFGMRSDDHARNAILHKTFNGYGVTSRDSTLVVIDSVNFIGAFPKNL